MKAPAAERNGRRKFGGLDRGARLAAGFMLLRERDAEEARTVHAIACIQMPLIARKTERKSRLEKILRADARTAHDSVRCDSATGHPRMRRGSPPLAYTPGEGTE